MKFVNKSTLKDIVSAEHALVCWGGRDPYEYSFVSEVRQDNIYNSQTKIQQVGDVPACKKVRLLLHILSSKLKLLNYPFYGDILLVDI